MAVKRLAAETNTIVVATIHQPAWETFVLFDNLLLLAQGQVVYNGPTVTIDEYLTSLGHPTPRHGNPADHAMALVNTEFYSSNAFDGGPSAVEHLDQLVARWDEHSKAESRSQRPSSWAKGSIEEEKRRPVGQVLSEGVRKTILLCELSELLRTRFES
jgi:ABC-type multidrug transport system ATPase subunit